jgi:hypothetical protein
MRLYEHVPPISFNTRSSFECFISIGAGFRYQKSDRDYLLFPEKVMLVIDAQGGHVACVTEM